MAESHQYFVEAQWRESALWAKAWQHALNKNVFKQYKWIIPCTREPSPKFFGILSMAQGTFSSSITVLLHLAALLCP